MLINWWTSTNMAASRLRAWHRVCPSSDLQTCMFQFRKISFWMKKCLHFTKQLKWIQIHTPTIPFQIKKNISSLIQNINYIICLLYQSVRQRHQFAFFSLCVHAWRYIVFASGQAWKKMLLFLQAGQTFPPTGQISLQCGMVSQTFPTYSLFSPTKSQNFLARSFPFACFSRSV